MRNPCIVMVPVNSHPLHSLFLQVMRVVVQSLLSSPPIDVNDLRKFLPLESYMSRRESASACSDYPVSAGSDLGTPRFYPFWLYPSRLYHFWLYQRISERFRYSLFFEACFSLQVISSGPKPALTAAFFRYVVTEVMQITASISYDGFSAVLIALLGTSKPRNPRHFDGIDGWRTSV